MSLQLGSTLGPLLLYSETNQFFWLVASININWYTTSASINGGPKYPDTEMEENRCRTVHVSQ